ncbi:TonB-dependent receptor [Archangium sp.]|uniref:TonB-dependent receptor n=1 Tax=Archangium sp. TaxID=1872627 RepID=UPI002EDB1EAE
MKLVKYWGVVLSLLVSAGAWALEGGTIRGTVYVAGNEPLPEAQVVLVGTDLVATTNGEGQFELRNVPPARQELTISFPGYRDSTRSVTVLEGQVVSLEADLELDEQFGEEIIVTGSRFGEKRLESPVAVETVGAKTIQQAGGVSFLTALAAMKGVDYVDNGINEKRISTRGYNNQFSSRMLSLVDGRLAQMPISGMPLGGQLPTPSLDVKSVEVVVGPASALYGANAHTGVIHVLTKSPWDESGVSAVLRGGTQQLLDGSVRVAGTLHKDFGYKFNGELFRGVDFAPDRALPSHYFGGPRLPPIFEADMLEEYDTRTAKAEGYLYYRAGDWNFKGGYGFSVHDGILTSNGGRLHMRGWQVHTQTVSASNPHWFAHVSRTSNEAGHSYQLERLAGVLQASGGVPSDPAALEGFKEQIRGIDHSEIIDSEVQYQNTFGGVKLVTGLQLRRHNPSTEGTSLSDGGGHRLRVTEFGGYVQADRSLLRDRLRLVAAARLDSHSSYTPQFSPKATVVYSLARTQHLRVGYNRAFKSPSLLENFLLINHTLVGNRTGFLIRDAEGNLLSELRPLVPEQVDAVELGYKATFFNRLLVDVVGYHSWYRNFISALTPQANPAQGTFAFYPDGRPVAEGTPVQGALSTYTNFGRSRVAGLDVGAEYQPSAHVLLNGSVSYIQVLSFQNSAPTQKALLLNVPEVKLKASITLQDLGVKNSFVRLFGRYQAAHAFSAGRWDSTLFFPDGKVPARFVADLGLGYTFDNGLAVSANVFNLLDDKGVEVLGAAPTRRSGSLQLAYNYQGLAF